MSYWEQFDDGRNPAADYDECTEDDNNDDYSDETEARIAAHNERNPDMRSFGSDGVSSINPHDEVEDDDNDEESSDTYDEDEMTEEDMEDAMWKPGE